MYFFRSILVILFIIVVSFIVYAYLTNNKIKYNRKYLFTYLVFIETLLVIFNTNLIFIIFLDFSCFLAYFLNLKKEALILSLVNILYFLMILNIPCYFYLIYVVYFILANIFKHNYVKTINYLILIKAFVTGFIYFINYNYITLNLIYLIFIFLYFYLLLELSLYFIKVHDNKEDNDLMLFQVAHEVKNPLAVCKGYLEMIDINDLEKVKKYLPIIKNEIDRSLTIMDDFLDLKRIIISNEIMDIGLLLEDINTVMLPVLSNKNIKLILPDLKDEYLIEGDYNHLKQVFINLIKNSVEAGSSRIKIEIKKKNKIINIKVIDNGCGIEDKELKNIGDIFYTTKTNGTGLGVNMAKEIIRLHNGTIKYESKLNKGTSVIINLPLEKSFI